MTRELGGILSMQRTETMGGNIRQHTASSKETNDCITRILQRRNNFMIDNGLANPSPVKLHVFKDHERAAVMKLWSAEYHNTALQLELQKHDSWKQRPDKSGH